MQDITFLEFCGIMIGSTLAYLVLGWLALMMGRFVSVWVHVLSCWSVDRKLTEESLANAWEGYDDMTNPLAGMDSVMYLVWPLGIFIVALAAVTSPFVAVYIKLKRSKFRVKIPKLKSIRLRPSWWNLSKLVSIINRVVIR